MVGHRRVKNVPMTRRDTLRWGLAVGAGLSMGLARPSEGAPANRLSLATGTASIADVTAFAAVDKGIFAKHGLDVKIMKYPTGVEMLNVLQSGEVDAAQLGTIPLLVAVSKGLPIVLIAYVHGDPNSKSYSANQTIIAAPRSGITPGNLSELAGKKVGLPLGTDAQAYLETLLEAHKIPTSRIRIINLGPQDTLVAIKQRSVDAVSIWEATASQIVLEVSGAIRVIEGHDPGWFTPGTLLTTRQIVDRKRALLERLLIAHAESHQWVRQNLNEAAAIASRWLTGLPPNVARVALRFPIFDVRMSRLTYEGFDEISIPWLVANHMMNQSITAKEAIEPSLIVKAMKDHPEFFTDLKPIAPQNQLT